jgi:hypothetical protein
MEMRICLYVPTALPSAKILYYPLIGTLNGRRSCSEESGKERNPRYYRESNSDHLVSQRVTKSLYWVVH